MATEWDDTVELTRWLQFAEQCAERWLSRRNAQSATPLCWDDLQDIVCEVRVAVLRFKLPEYMTEWEPLLTKYVQRVCERAYARAQRERQRLASLDALPESLHPLVETRADGLDDSWFLARVASVLKQMPAHHAAAFVLALDGEMAHALQAHGVLPELLSALAERAPLCDKAIGAALGLIPIAEPEFTKVRINENPLLKVPSARWGNRVGAPLAVPLAKRGEP
jgi:hypothetical protein